MVSIIVFLLILSLLIFVHELGHFLAAKRAGIVVEEFGLGFPPRLAKLGQGEGQVQVGGQRPLVIGRHTVVPRDVVVGAQVILETQEGADGRTVVTRIERAAAPPAGESSAPAIVGVVESLSRPTEYTLNWIPFGGFVKMLGEEDPRSPGSFASKGKATRFAVLVAGPVMNFLAAIVVFSIMYMTGVPEAEGKVIVQTAVPDSPAAHAGIQPGDIILRIDGRKMSNPVDVALYVNQKQGQPVEFELQRGERIISFSLTPRADPPEGEGAVGIVMDFEPTGQVTTTFPPGQALVNGARLTAFSVVNTLLVPVAILRGFITPEDARPVGPYGIYQLADSAVEASVTIQGLYPLLILMGILSTALAITNLLPLPALDGGRILFIIVEAIRGKRISPDKEGFIHFVGLALLLTLMLVITYQDIANPIRLPDWTALY